MKSQVLHTVWCHISCEAAGEFWHWSLSGVKGLKTWSRDFWIAHAKFSVFWIQWFQRAEGTTHKNIRRSWNPAECLFSSGPLARTICHARGNKLFAEFSLTAFFLCWYWKYRREVGTRTNSILLLKWNEKKNKQTTEKVHVTCRL